LELAIVIFSTEHQLDLPDSFPVEELVEFMACARSVLLTPSISDVWKEFGGCSNLIGWRFRACYEDMMRYIESWRTCGPDVSFEEMYRRERALFGMFTAGVSCIESTCYALHALVSHPNLFALPFGESEQRSCNPTRLKDRLSKYPAARDLANALNILIDSDEWRLWVDFRNRMTHRSNLPRIIEGAAGGLPPPAKALHFAATSSTQAFEADVSHLEAMFAWLAQSLRNLLIEGASLCESSVSRNASQVID